MKIDQDYFASSLIALMEGKGISRYQLAKDLGFSQTSIANWINKVATPSRRSVEAIAGYFGVSITQLTGRSHGLTVTSKEPYFPDDEDGATYDDFGNIIKKAPTAGAEDAELNALLEDLRTREDMRMLFKLAHDATPDDVRAAVKIIEALRKE